jgi:hydroxymethylglutaryl-CoA reductase
MARRTITISDFSSKEIGDPKESVKITLTYCDGRRGVVVSDAHISDEIVKKIAEAGRSQARRGRPKAGS